MLERSLDIDRSNNKDENENEVEYGDGEGGTGKGREGRDEVQVDLVLGPQREGVDALPDRSARARERQKKRQKGKADLPDR
jgi:hypothetical protein